MFTKKYETRPDQEIFVFFDSKAQTYGMPVFAVNQLSLIRDLTNMFQKPEEQEKNQLFTNAEDFSIFKIGSYEKSTGIIRIQNHEHIMNLHDLRAVIPKPQRTDYFTTTKDLEGAPLTYPKGIVAT